MESEGEVHSWLRQQLLDAEEEGRTWRLRAIQAEAELRALQVEVPGSPTQGDRPDTQLILSEVLGLEKHLKDWEPWRNKLLEATQSAKAESERLQVRLEEQRAQLPNAERQATEARLEAQVLREARNEVRTLHEARVSEAAKEIHKALVTGIRPSGDSLISMKQGEHRLQSIRSSIGQLDDDVKETERRREELCMRLEELRTRHLNDVETRSKSVKDVQMARQALQARQSALTKLQGEASRSRARWDKKKKQLEVQLQQSLLELGDARARKDSAEEALRKVRQQHSKQLKSVKSQTSSLQAEVDAHLQASEAAEREMQDLQQKEAELEGSQQRFLQLEEELRDQAVRARERLGSLEQQREQLESQSRALLEELHPLEEEWEQVELQAKALHDLADADSLRTKEHQDAAAACKEEIDAHLREFAAQADELTTLSSLEAEVLELKGRQKLLASEKSQLEDSAKGLQQSLELQLADLREAQRRSMQLKAAHDDFVKLLPPSSLRQVAMSVAAEQSLGRMTRKAEQLHGYLEGGRPTGSARRGRLSAGQDAPPSKLVEQLMAAAAAIVREELSASRRQLLELQQRLAETSRKRGQEILNWRSQRRQLEEELSEVETKVHASASEKQAVVGELEKHLQDLRAEATKKEEQVAAEYSDLMQQQSLQKDELEAEVEQLKRLDEEERAALQAASLDRDKERQRLKELDEELARLKAEEEQLLQAHVSLKAELMGRAKSLPPPGDRERPPLSLPERTGSKASSQSEEPRQRQARGTPATASQASGSPRPALAQLPETQGLLLSTTSRPSGYSGSDASSRVQAVSPETSPRMVRGAPLAASLPALAGSVPRPILAKGSAASRTTSIMISPRHWGLDKVYTWPRQYAPTLEHLDLRYLAG